LNFRVGEYVLNDGKENIKEGLGLRVEEGSQSGGESGFK